MLILFLIVSLIQGFCRDINFDGRAFIIDGRRRLLISGSIHYPRSTPQMWPKLFHAAKAGGLDVVETYVFWNGHEAVENEFDFAERYDIVRFVKEAAKAGLYVMVRIGPYVCAEWNFGGFPVWLKLKKGIVFRTYNDIFMEKMKAWTEKVVKLLKDSALMYPQGGPVIALQVENEYGLVEKKYGEDGRKYVQWAAQMALATNALVPWIMCVQEDAPKEVINTCNGFYCDNWIEGHRRRFPTQPALFTEHWPGWFQAWSGRKPVRPPQDVAFSVARWFARGGALMNYYMYHGGSNFGRTSGNMLTTSYDYDAPLDEYGLPSNPKYTHLQHMHDVLHKYEQVIMGQDQAVIQPLGNQLEAHVYGKLGQTDCVAFLSNINSKDDGTVTFNGRTFVVPAWSVTILQECTAEVYNTAKVAGTKSKAAMVSSLPQANVVSTGWLDEPIGASGVNFTFGSPAEQLSLTKGLTDYLWYRIEYNSRMTGRCMLDIDRVFDIAHVFVEGAYISSGKRAHFKVADGMNRIDILLVDMGIPNFGAFIERNIKGISGNVRLCWDDIRRYKWVHTVGLKGEVQKYFDPKVAATLPWNPNISETNIRPLTWYAKKISLKLGNKVFALDLSGMKKGYAWVNGHNIGRYFQLQPGNSCQFCDYRGSFGSNKCCTGDDVFSQRYYHVPTDWLLDGENLVVLFEELGGHIAKVNFVERDANTICGYVYEDSREERSYLELECPYGNVVSEVEFASFGQPVGECGRYRVGECHAADSAEIVKTYCGGKSKCQIPVSYKKLGDPCPEQPKRFAAQVKCTAKATTN